LGERELCKLEVVGSIPIGSTMRQPNGGTTISFEDRWALSALMRLREDLWHCEGGVSRFARPVDPYDTKTDRKYHSQEWALRHAEMRASASKQDAWPSFWAWNESWAIKR
jgi:hypothetical protein